MKQKLTAFACAQLLCLSLFANAEPYISEDGWEIGLGLGGSYSVAEDLTIKQDAFSDVKINDAQFNSHPFSAPLYYGFRLGYWFDQQAIEFEHIHQKLYLDDLPDNVQHFEITDGYNLLFINYARQINNPDLTLRAGIGAVVAHPQIEVNGVLTHEPGGGAIPRVWDTGSGYQWAGIAGQIAIEKNFRLSKHLTFSLEGKATIATADVDLVNGSVEVPNKAFHALAWIKYHF